MSTFVKAERKKAKVKIALTGPSGAGKTYSALLLASGLGKKIAVGDSENDSASLYEGLIDFDVKKLEETNTDSYIQTIEEAEELGYDVLILDSISHQWKTLLEEKTQVDARGGNSFTNWAKFTPMQDKFLRAILKANLHIICTARSKQEYAIVSDSGKNKVQKLGLAPVQREGMEYEFTTVFDIAENNEAKASKDRTGLFKDRIFKISKKTGEEILAWINSGKSPAPSLGDIANLLKEKNIEPSVVKAFIKTEFDVESSSDLSGEQITKVHQMILGL